MSVTRRSFQFSLHDLLMAVTAVALVFGSFSVYGITGVAISTLALGCYLTYRGGFIGKSLKYVGGVVLFLSVAILAVIVAAWLLLGVGPLLPYRSWPPELSRMAEIAETDTAGAKAAGVGNDLFDREYVWRLSVAPDRLDAVMADCGMVSVRAQDVPAVFWRLFPPWWRPRYKKNNQYLSTPNFPGDSRGPDGYHFFAIYDPESHWLYVWHKDNF